MEVTEACYLNVLLMVDNPEANQYKLEDVVERNVIWKGKYVKVVA